MLKNWFKYETIIYEEEDGCYMQAASSFFDKFIFSWQTIPAKMYRMRDSWMTETRKFRLEILFETEKNIIDLTRVYDEISNVLEELLGACHFDNHEPILKALFTNFRIYSRNLKITVNE